MIERIIDVFKRSSHAFKFCLLVTLIMPIFYFIAIFNMPYGYYIFLKIITLIFIAGYSCAYSITQESILNFPCISSWAIFVLFNPFIPFEFGKGLWIFFDFLAIVILIVSFFIILEKSELSLRLDSIERYSAQKTTHNDDFNRSAVDLLTAWERERADYERSADKFNNGLIGVVKEIQAIINQKIASYENGLIKTSDIAKIDFSYYIFFNVYVPLCSLSSERFCRVFYKVYESVIFDTFLPYVSDPAFFEKLFNDRSDTYDNILLESQKQGFKRADHLKFQISQYISKDLWSNDYFSKQLFVVDLDKKFTLDMEISDLFFQITDSLDSCFDKLQELDKTYSDMNNSVKSWTGCNIEDFSDEE